MLFRPAVLACIARRRPPERADRRSASYLALCTAHSYYRGVSLSFLLFFSFLLSRFTRPLFRRQFGFLFVPELWSIAFYLFFFPLFIPSWSATSSKEETCLPLPPVFFTTTPPITFLLPFLSFSSYPFPDLDNGTEQRVFRRAQLEFFPG